MQTVTVLLIISALPLLLLGLLGLFAWRYVRFIRREIEKSGPPPPLDAGPAGEERAPARPLVLRWLDTAAAVPAPAPEGAEAAAVTRRMRVAFAIAGASHMVLTTAAVVGALRSLPMPALVGVAYLVQLPGLVLLLWSATGGWRPRLAIAAVYVLLGIALVPALGGFARAIAAGTDYLGLWPLFGLAFLLVPSLRPIAVGLAAVVAYFLGAMPAFALAQSMARFSLHDVAPWLLALGFALNVLGIVLLLWLLRRPAVRGPVIVLVAMALAGVAFAWITPGLPIGPILFAVPGNVFQALLVWLVFKVFVRLKERQLLPDQVLHSHLCWLYLTAYFARVASRGSFPRYGVLAVLAFVVQASLLHLLLHRIRSERRTVQPRRLLLLRVFGSGRRPRWLLDVLDDSWRRLGRIDLIVGPDVALRTVSARMLEAFLRRQTDRVFLNTREEVERRVSRLDSRLQLDARFPLNELHCRGDTWQPAVNRLAPASDAILMDFRRFTRNALGCTYELNELIRLVSLERIVVLTDHETDAPALEETAQRAWARLPAGSPNLAHANPVLTVLRCSNRSADERMVVSSLSAASRG